MLWVISYMLYVTNIEPKNLMELNFIFYEILLNWWGCRCTPPEEICAMSILPWVEYNSRQSIQE